MNTTPRRLLLLALAALIPMAGRAGNITIKGSDTLVILAQKWAEVYMRDNPGVKIQVTGGGSGVGLAALQNGTTDLAFASRRIKPPEAAGCVKAFGQRPTEYVVALDGLTIYVHPGNPVAELSLEDLAAIFAGRLRNWRELGGPDAPITLYGRENSSGTYEFFKQRVLAGQDFAPAVQGMPGTAAVLQAVARDPTGIGYGGAAYGHGAKHVRLRPTPGDPAVEPTETTVVNGTYPIWRHLYIYVNPSADQREIAAFLRWIRSDVGQALVKAVGYYPLPGAARSK